jgi:hypothetical protein
MPNVRKLRVSNPHRRKRNRSSRRRARRNPAEVLIVANPRKRRSSRRRNRSHSRRRSNPFRATRVKRYRHSRRRNPGVAGFSTTELIKLAGGAAVGVVGSKYLAQVALGGNNSGAMGAAAQAVATLALAWAANKFAGKDVATGVAAGGFGAIALNLFQQYVGTGGSMSGLGDPDMARFLGDFQSGKTISVPGQWTSPVVAAPSQASGRRRG